MKELTEKQTIIYNDFVDAFKITEMENEIKLKDYFAAKTLEGIFANNDMWVAMCMDRQNCTRDKDNDSVEDYVAQQCYKMAQAMLKERKQ